MNFIKSKFAKRLIIILVVLMIFNVIIPREVHAWDFAGILMKPFTAMIVSFLVGIDLQIGVFVNVVNLATNGIGTIMEYITDNKDDTGLGGKSITEAVAGATDIAISSLFISPDTIFAGNIKMLDANIFDATSTNTFEGSNLIGTIKKGIAKTYVTLRDICAMIMLAGLIFTGIRILVTGNTPTKMSSWKQLLQDWLIGIILLIFSHVIMIVIFYVSDTITNVLKGQLFGFGSLNFQLAKKCLTSFDSAEEIICMCMFGYLIYLTVIFLVSYFKRLLWICVLIVLAPVVSVMYSFGTTKSIYSKWLREFMMMVFIQPFHLIIYYTLVSIPLNMVSSGGFDLSTSNFMTIIYALGVLTFIKKAEKYFTGLFGFNQGLSKMATAESGRKTVEKTIKTVEKAVVVAGTALATGGIGLAAGGAAAGGAATGGSAAGGSAAGGTATGGAAAGGTLPGSATLGETTIGGLEEGDLVEGIDMDGLFSDDSMDLGKNMLELEDDDQQYNLNKSTEYEDNARLNDGNNIGADNVIINANTISLNGSGIATNNDKIDKNVDTIDSTDRAKKVIDSQEINTDPILEIKDGEEEIKDNSVRRLGKPLRNTGLFMGVLTGQKGVVEALSQSNMLSDIGNTKIGEKLKGTNFAQKNKDRFMAVGEAFKQMEKNGDLEELYTSFRELGDTFDSEGGGEWKDASERRKARVKENNEQEIEATINNKNNIKLLSGPIIAELKSKYPNAKQEWIGDKAETMAKAKLEKLAKSYIPQGITNVSDMIDLDKFAKANGVTAEQAVVHSRGNEVGWNHFNTNSKNILNISQSYKEEVNSVSEAIPAARTYYDNGYRNVNDMQRLDKMSTQLNISPELSMKIDKALKKKGGEVTIKNVSGLSEEQQKKLRNNVKEITDGYKSIRGDLNDKNNKNQIE